MANEKQIIQFEQREQELEELERDFSSSSSSEEDSPLDIASFLNTLLIQLRQKRSFLLQTKGNEEKLDRLEGTIKKIVSKMVTTLRIPADEGDPTSQLLLANALLGYYKELGITKRESIRQACPYLEKASDNSLVSTLQLACIYKSHPKLKDIGTPETICKWFLDCLNDLNINKNTAYKSCYKSTHATLTDCFTVYLHSQSNAVLEQLKNDNPISLKNKPLHGIISLRWGNVADFETIIKKQYDRNDKKLSESGVRAQADQSVKSFVEKYRISQSELQTIRK
jgi:hypothetical protein